VTLAAVGAKRLAERLREFTPVGEEDDEAENDGA
jgi:hypothetical protein